MARTVHMNTPELTANGDDMNDDDNDNDDKELQEHQLIEQLQSQLVQDRIRRTQHRDYGRILRQYNTPDSEYRAPPNTRSVYLYDPYWQQQFAKQQKVPSSSSQKRPITTTTVRPIAQSFRAQDRHVASSKLDRNQLFQFTPRTKYMLDLYHSVLVNQQQNNHPIPSTSGPSVSSSLVRRSASQQQHSVPTRSSQIPTLPSIKTAKQRNGSSSSVLLQDKHDHDALTANGRGVLNHRPSVKSTSTSNVSRRKLSQVVIPPSS
jgi:hypothetical protein